MLRQRCPGRRSWGCTRRGHRIRATKISSDTLATANILEHAESRACLASDYLIREIVWREIRSRIFSSSRRKREENDERITRREREETARRMRSKRAPRRDRGKVRDIFLPESSIPNWNLLPFRRKSSVCRLTDSIHEPIINR